MTLRFALCTRVEAQIFCPLAFESRVSGHRRSVTTYKAGQSFSELPGDRHRVSANASETQPAKLLAVFVADTNETELTIPFGN